MNAHPVRLLDQVRNRIRMKHYSIRTEEAYVSWIKRFVIFHDKTLVEMAAHQPKTLDEMVEIHGVGVNKCERYGQLFIEVIKDYVRN